MAQFLFPKPRDWEVFEDIVCDVFSKKYHDDNFQRYARRGQQQHGVDVVGRGLEGLVGIQCKHRPTRGISIKEVDDEIARAERFTPPLRKMIVATSASTDGDVQSHVLEVSEKRTAQGLFPVEIVFWEKLVDQLVSFPDLLYKHFTSYFPASNFENLTFPTSTSYFKETVEWPVSAEALKWHIAESLGGIVRAEPYSLSIGVSDFPSVSFLGRTDVQISLHGILADKKSPSTQFTRVQQTFSALLHLVQPPFFSQELTIHLQARLSHAFLFGWVFRRVAGFNLRIVSQSGVWSTKGLPDKSTGIFDDLPTLLNSESNEVAIVLNLSRRNITSSVHDFVTTWPSSPRVVLSYSLPEGRIINAAHALSVSREIAQKIKNINDSWGMTRIHVFGVLPAALACLIGYHLNAVCPLSLYFRDETRTTYKLAGTVGSPTARN